MREVDRLVVYDLENQPQGYFEQKNDTILAYDMNEKLVGSIVTRGNKTIFLPLSGLKI